MMDSRRESKVKDFIDTLIPYICIIEILRKGCSLVSSTNIVAAGRKAPEVQLQGQCR